MSFWWNLDIFNVFLIKSVNRMALTSKPSHGDSSHRNSMIERCPLWAKHINWDGFISKSTRQKWSFRQTSFKLLNICQRTTYRWRKYQFDYFAQSMSTMVASNRFVIIFHLVILSFFCTLSRVFQGKSFTLCFPLNFPNFH